MLKQLILILAVGLTIILACTKEERENYIQPIRFFHENIEYELAQGSVYWLDTFETSLEGIDHLDYGHIYLEDTAYTRNGGEFIKLITFIEPE